MHNNIQINVYDLCKLFVIIIVYKHVFEDRGYSVAYEISTLDWNWSSLSFFLFWRCIKIRCLHVSVIHTRCPKHLCRLSFPSILSYVSNSFCICIIPLPMAHQLMLEQCCKIVAWQEVFQSPIAIHHKFEKVYGHHTALTHSTVHCKICSW